MVFSSPEFLFFFLPIFHTLRGAFEGPSGFSLQYVFHIFGNALWNNRCSKATEAGLDTNRQAPDRRACAAVSVSPQSICE